MCQAGRQQCFSRVAILKWGNLAGQPFRAKARSIQRLIRGSRSTPGCDLCCRQISFHRATPRYKEGKDGSAGSCPKEMAPLLGQTDTPINRFKGKIAGLEEKALLAQPGRTDGSHASGDSVDTGRWQWRRDNLLRIPLVFIRAQETPPH